MYDIRYVHVLHDPRDKEQDVASSRSGNTEHVAGYTNIPESLWFAVLQ